MTRNMKNEGEECDMREMVTIYNEITVVVLLIATDERLAGSCKNREIRR